MPQMSGHSTSIVQAFSSTISRVVEVVIPWLVPMIIITGSTQTAHESKVFVLNTVGVTDSINPIS